MAVPGDAFFEAGLELNLSDKMTSELGEAQAKAETFSSRMQDTADRIDRVGKRWAAAGQKMALTGAVIASGPLIAAKSFADFEGKMTESLAIMGDVSDHMRNRMAKEARNVADATDGMIASGEIAESYFFLASAGLDAQRSLRAIEPAARFAQAGMFDMKRATDILTDAQSALGLSSEDATENMRNMRRVSDALVKANTLANASVQQFGDALTNKAAAQLRNMNVEMEQGIAALAAFADQGLKGRRAGERLNILLRDLPKAVRENQAAFSQMGIQIFDSQGNMRNLADVVADFEDTIGSLPAEQQKARLAQLGLNRQVADSLTQLVGTSEAMAEYESELQKAAGTSEEVAEKQQQGLKVAFGDVRQSASDLLTVLGKVQSGPLLGLFNRTANFIDRLRAWAEANEGLATTLVQSTAAIGGLLAVVGTGVAAFGFFAQGVASALSAFAAIAAFFEGGALVSGISAISSAFGSLTAGVLAPLALAAAALIKFWRPVAAFFKGLFTGIFDALRPLTDEFGALMRSMRPVINLAFALLSPVGDNVNQFQRWMAVGKAVGRMLTTFIISPLRLVISVVRGTAEGFMVLVGRVNEAMNLISGGDWFGAGKKIIQGLVEGIFAMQGELFNTVSSIAGEVRSYLPFSPAEKGPLSDLDKTGPAFVNTIAEGMSSSPLVDAFGMPSRAGGRPPQRGTGSRTIQVTNEVHIHGDANAEDVRRGVERGGDRVVRKIKREMEEENRTRF